MKTRNFTLIASILMMGAVIAATGQPERGAGNGNHEKNSRREQKSVSGTESGKTGNRRSDAAKNGRELTNNRIHTDNNPVLRKESTLNRKEVMENRNNNGIRRDYSYSGRNESDQGVNHEKKGISENKGTRNENKSFNGNKSGENRYNRDKSREYSGNREFRVNPAPRNRDNRSFWGDRNYSRNEWEHRNYNWSDHNRNFSNYYRKGYIPYYFRDNRHYWYYPEYGHILRGFLHEPVVFYSGNIPYYFEDGFFYRFYPGIGYVWVEEPYGIWFNELPYRAVKVRIGGKVYFRFGNAYFSLGHFGFHLVVLPDRYYDRFNDRRVAFEISARF